MRILFVTSLTDAHTPHRPLRSPEQIQFGISYLSACLQQAGHQTRLAVLSSTWGRYNRHLILESARDFPPDLIAFTAVSSEFPFIAAVADWSRHRFPHAHRILGGPHATLRPREALAFPFDAVCVGEGEATLVATANRLACGTPLEPLGNLWIRRAGRVIPGPQEPFLQDLDQLPFPDRSMWSPWITPDSNGRPAVLLGRGCPYLCTYCSNHALSRAAPGPYVRLRRPGPIVAEIAALAAAAETRGRPLDEIALEVESIDLDRAWALDLCAALARFNAERPRPVGFATNLRVAPRSDPTPLFEAMRKAGFRRITLGLESGSDRVRREVMKRSYSTQDVLDTVREARRHGLEVVLQNIIGVPGETEAEALETALLNRILEPERYYVGVFHPYPGTELHAACVRRGIVATSLRGGRERSVPVLDLPEFPAHRIRRTLVWFDFHVSAGRRPALRIASRALRTWVRTHPRLDLPARRLRGGLPLRRLERLMVTIGRSWSGKQDKGPGNRRRRG